MDVVPIFVSKGPPGKFEFAKSGIHVREYDSTIKTYAFMVFIICIFFSILRY